MPDQSSAATEHAILQEISAPLASLPEDPLPIAADVDFPVALRGYDRLAVDAYVKKTSQLVAELQATRSPDAAIRKALERVGEQISGILQRAHESAEQITSQSRIEAENRLEAARREAAQITADARNQLQDLDSETDRIWGERHRIVEDSRSLARQLLALADSAAERFPEDEEGAAMDESPDALAAGEEAELPTSAAEPEEDEAAEGPLEDGEASETEEALESEPPPDLDATAIMPPVRPSQGQDPLR